MKYKNHSNHFQKYIFHFIYTHKLFWSCYFLNNLIWHLIIKYNELMLSAFSHQTFSTYKFRFWQHYVTLRIDSDCYLYLYLYLLTYIYFWIYFKFRPKSQIKSESNYFLYFNLPDIKFGYDYINVNSRCQFEVSHSAVKNWICMLKKFDVKRPLK